VLAPTATNDEMKLAIDRLNRKLDFIFKHLAIQYPDDSVPVYVLEAQEYIRLGRDSDAVKVVREHTAVGIIEARAIVEDLGRRTRLADAFAVDARAMIEADEVFANSLQSTTR
jgi:hypothetical protein